MRNAFLNRLRERKYLVLLLTMVSTIVVQPLAHGFLAGVIIYEVLRNSARGHRPLHRLPAQARAPHVPADRLAGHGQ